MKVKWEWSVIAVWPYRGSGRFSNWMNLIYFKMMDETAKKRYEPKVTETLS
jgi:hypothetical protein